MIPRPLADVTAQLPPKLASEVEGYVNAVDAAAPSIARECGITLTTRLREDFLFVVGIRRLWSTVNGAYWLTIESGRHFKKARVPVVRAGSLLLGPGEEFNQELQKLRSQLGAILEEHDLMTPVSMSHVSEVLLWLTDRS